MVLTSKVAKAPSLRNVKTWWYLALFWIGKCLSPILRKLLLAMLEMLKMSKMIRWMSKIPSKRPQMEFLKQIGNGNGLKTSIMVSSKANSSELELRGLELIPGLMAGSILGFGTKINNTVKQFSRVQKVSKGEEDGKMESEWTGTTVKNDFHGKKSINKPSNCTRNRDKDRKVNRNLDIEESVN